MINVHSSTTIDFSNNGLATLDKCVKCEVTEELNGCYSLELEYPLFSNDKYKYLIEDNIIQAPTPRGPQLFRIKYTTKNFSTITVYALHIFYDLTSNFLEDCRPTALNGEGALVWILSGTQYEHRFKGYSNINNTNTSYYIRKNPVDAIMGSDDNSFLNLWGGELLRDNYNVIIDASIGEDRGFEILYGKNMTGIEDKSDYSNIATRIMPIGRDENNNDLMLPEKYIDSPLINNYPFPHITTKDFSDLKVNSDASQGTVLTKDQVFTQMRQNVKDLYSVSNVDKPVLDLTVDFVELSKTDEYKNMSALQQVYLGDIVTVKHSDIGIDLKAKVTKYTYDAVLEKYTTLTLNDKAALSNQSITLADIVHDVRLSVDDVKVISDKIKNAMGGYVVKRQNEILIMDTKDIATATKVWRWDINGLGYSSTGYNGTYGTAITMDGEINCNFLRTGELNANLIKAGVISSKDGTFKLSLDENKMSTYSDDSHKALDFINRTIIFFDFITANKEIGCIQTMNTPDGNNAGIEIQARPGAYVGLGLKNDDGTFRNMLRIKNDGGNQGSLYYDDIKAYDGTIELGNGKALFVHGGIITGVM